MDRTRRPGLSDWGPIGVWRIRHRASGGATARGERRDEPTGFIIPADQGLYTVALTVTDDGGLTDTVSVTGGASDCTLPGDDDPEIKGEDSFIFESATSSLGGSYSKQSQPYSLDSSLNDSSNSSLNKVLDNKSSHDSLH